MELKVNNIIKNKNTLKDFYDVCNNKDTHSTIKEIFELKLSENNNQWMDNNLYAQICTILLFCCLLIKNETLVGKIKKFQQELIETKEISTSQQIDIIKFTKDIVDHISFNEGSKFIIQAEDQKTQKANEEDIKEFRNI